MSLNLLFILLAFGFSMTFLGKSLVGIFIGLSVIFSAFIIIRNYQTYCRRDVLYSLITAREILALLIMIGVWGISASQGIRPDISVIKVIEFFGMIVGGVIIYTAIQSQEFKWDSFFKITTVISSIASLLMLVRPYGLDFGIIFRSSYGSVIAMALPFTFYLIWTEQTARKYLWWFCGLLMAAGIFASDGRTSWVALGFLVVIAPFLMPAKTVKSRGVFLGLLLMLSTVAAWGGFQSYKDKLGAEHFQGRVENMVTSNGFGSGRLVIWDTTIELIEEKPLLGYGIRAARFLGIKNADAQDAYVIHVHNAVLEIALETGILGLVAFLGVIFIFVFNFLRAYFQSNNDEFKPKAMTIFLSCIVYGICSMALTSIFHTWWFLYLVVLVILLKTAELKLYK